MPRSSSRLRSLWRPRPRPRRASAVHEAGRRRGVLAALTSTENPLVKRAASLHVRKYRQRERAFLVEGDDLVAAGLTAGLRPEAVFVVGEAAEVAARLAESGHLLADSPVYPVDERVAAKLSTLETPASTMAIFAIPEPPALGELRSPGRAPALVVYADRLADPGNLGTLVRAAAAFAAAALVASPGSVDLYSPKVVRAGMGAVFALPLYQDVALERVASELGARAVYGVVAHGGVALDRVAPVGPALLVVGAERAGLSDEALACTTELVTIPLAAATGSGVESLNAGVAGAIALYELSRRLAAPAPQKE